MNGEPERKRSFSMLFSSPSCKKKKGGVCLSDCLKTPIDFDLPILTKQQSRKIFELERTGLLFVSVPIKDAKRPTYLSENDIRL